MKRILFSVIETTEFKNDFKLGCIQEYNYNTEKEIYSFSSTNQVDYQKEMISKLTRRKRKIIYYHNLTFDSKFFIDFLNNYFDNVKIIRSQSKIICIKCFKLRRIEVNNKIKYQNDCLLELRDCKIPFLALKYMLEFLNDTFNLFWKLEDFPLTIASLSKKLMKLFYRVNF